MEEIEKMVFGDREIVPDNELIFSKIGDKRELWEEIMDFIKVYYPDAAGEWRYYNDGKQWLYKLVRKKKTIFWLGIIEWTFRISFWFPDRAEVIINESNLTPDLKEQFVSSKKYGAIRALTIVVKNKPDVENVKTLIGIRSRIK